LSSGRTEQETKVLDADSIVRTVERSLLGLYIQFRQEDVKAPADPQNASLIAFNIQSGETAATIAPRLERYGLIRDATLFRYLLRYRGVDTRLEAGDYYLRPNMTMDEIIEELQHGRAQTVTVTVPEGWRAELIAELLEERGLVSAEEFMRLVNTGGAMNYAFLRDRPPGSSLSLEGYLFPDTYELPKNVDAHLVVEIMLSNFDAKVTPEMRALVAAQGKTLHEVITLASIVEREAVIAEERPIIASVYLNRLAAGMYLQADPTVQYAKGKDPQTGKWWGHMLQEEAQTTLSPYNTFLHPGLPPGPICNPGLASIKAVINPAQTNYLFFFSKGDGSHAFAATYEEHLRNQKKYQH